MKHSAFEDFNESAQEALDFARCQRPDGSFYGTGGVCRKGTPAGAKEKKSGGEFRTRPKGAIEADMKRLTSSGAMNQKGMAGVKAREEHAALKAELNKPLKGQAKREVKKPESSGGSSVANVKALDKKAKEANKKADAAEKAWRKAGAKPGAQQKEVRRLDKEAKAADKAADKAAKGLAKMRKQDEKLAAAQAKVKEQLKTASPARAKALRAKRADLEEARTKLKYAMKGLGGGQSKLTGAQVKSAVGTAD